ncbi:MAG: tRNA pseudouridine(38-40) synthase TruA [Ruminococcaceae bacterium]|nr:tRNA pseudouridine(38-40) synthase TruA [Oscillospiraceae bacterium]
MKLLFHVSFLGTAYCGYQVQPNGVTVQQKLNEATKSLFGYECDIIGCSRTDSGVHANQFCATVSKKGSSTLETTIPTERIPQAISPYLPEDISVFRAEAVDEGFHPRYDVKYKEYIYQIWNRSERNPFLFDRSWHYPKAISEDAVSKMNEAAAQFVGTHDFASYMASDSKIRDTVRTVYEAEVTRRGDMLIFRVSADGFLYNMVRILTGTLIAVAEGKIGPEDIAAITAAKDRRLAGITVPAHGLFLNRVVY